jgi:glutathione synthase
VAKIHAFASAIEFFWANDSTFPELPVYTERNIAMSAKESFVFVMNPYATLNLRTETSLLLMQELLDRGHLVFWLQEDELSLQHTRLIGNVHAVESVSPFQLSPGKSIDLDTFDALVQRKDPPFDTGYLQLTLLLDFLDSRVVQFNEAHALRNFNEKLLPLRWPEFTPPTLVSSNSAVIETFVAAHGEAILKPLHDCSGRGIRKVTWDAQGSFRSVIAKALSTADGLTRLLVVQKFLPTVSKGDKRVFLVAGEPVGAVSRLPRSGTFLANIHQGAICEPATLTDRERHIIANIAPTLRREGIFLAGADFIDGFLTEINITSPSAARQINAVSGLRLEQIIVDAMLQRLREIRPPRADSADRATVSGKSVPLSSADHEIWPAGVQHEIGH